jgi:hypothetical protein
MINVGGYKLTSYYLSFLAEVRFFVPSALATLLLQLTAMLQIS